MKTQLFIDTKETNIGVRNRSFVIENKTTKRIISPKKIESIAIISNANINASAIKLAADNDIPIFYYNYTGQLIAQLRSPSFLKHASLRYKQIQFMNSQKGREWAVQQIALKTKLQLQTLHRLVKEKPIAYAEVNNFIDKIKEKKQNLVSVDLKNNTSRNSIMGIEGGIARLYYKSLNITLSENYKFKKRSRMPGMDYFNVALNYLYGMTYSQVSKALEAAGLDTFVGALHTTPYKESLVYDSIEPIRPVIDRLLLGLCKENQLTGKHFKALEKGYWLSKEGKKLLIPLYTDYLQSRIKINGKVSSIENHLYLWARQLKITIQNTQTNVPTIL